MAWPGFRAGTGGHRPSALSAWYSALSSVTRTAILVLGKGLEGDVPRDPSQRVGDSIAESLGVYDLESACQLHTPWLCDFGQVT